LRNTHSEEGLCKVVALYQVFLGINAFINKNMYCTLVLHVL
jgi:hypothetical protein